MIARGLILGMILWLAQGVSGSCLIEDSKGMTWGKIMPKEGKGPGITRGGITYFAQKAGRVVELKDESSRNAALAPPCSVIGISGEKMTVKDFYGRQGLILVEDEKELRGVKIGDKVVVKDGVLIVGPSPQ
jgi:hypothetical protein